MSYNRIYKWLIIRTPSTIQIQLPANFSINLQSIDVPNAHLQFPTYIAK